MPCQIPDEQVGKIMGAIVLPEAWMDRVLAKVHLADEVKRVEQERRETEQRLRRLAQVYLDNLVSNEEYRRQKRQLEDLLASLVVPGVDAALEAGKLLEDLPKLWQEANLGERRRLLVLYAGCGLRRHGGGEGRCCLDPKASLHASVRGRDHTARVGSCISP